MDIRRNQNFIIIYTRQIMCYFPIKIKNKRFVPTKKNGYKPPVCTDERLRYIEVECGYCFECRKRKRNAWRVRNFEQLRETPTAIFFTGTVSPERYDYIKNKYNLKTDNEIITKIHRLFLERIRKETGKSMKHWCVSFVICVSSFLLMLAWVATPYAIS